MYVLGPGCSSVGYGATQEIGPFFLDNDGRGLKLNSYAWNKGLNFFISPSYSSIDTNPDLLNNKNCSKNNYPYQIV